MPKQEESQLELILKAPAVIISFISLDALCIFIILILLSLLIYKLIRKKGDEESMEVIMNWDFQEEPLEEQLPKKFSMICVICIIIYLLIYLLEMTYFLMIYKSEYAQYIKDNTNIDYITITEWLQTHKQFGYTVSWIDLLSWILFILSKIMLFIIFIGRLYFSFRNTSYSSKKWVYIIFIICIPILILLMTINEVIAFQIDLNYTNNAQHETFKAHSLLEMLIMTIFMIVFDGIITFCVIYLFYQKLYLVLLAKTRTNRYISGAELELNESQLYFINKIVKHTLLCFISLILAQFVWYYSLITFICFDGNINNIWIITYYFVIIDGCLSVICVYLTYKFNDGLYYKLCNKPHKLLLSCCTKFAKREYEKQAKQGFDGLLNGYRHL